MNPNPLPTVSGTSSPEFAISIRTLIPERGIVLDPFSVCGASAFEFLRLGRRAVVIERDPAAAFFAEILLRPSSLPLLQWAFEDVRHACHEELTALFATHCPKCGKQGIIAAIERRNGKPVRIEYSCACANRRLSKKPDAADQTAEGGIPRLEIPFWHPTLQLPGADGTRRYPPDFMNRRTAAALSIILNAVENLAETSARDVLRAAFASALEMEEPHERPARTGRAGKRGRAAIQREENPWHAFEAGYRVWHETKTESNRMLPDAALGHSFADLESGRAKAFILAATGPDPAADELPEGSIDGVVCQVPDSRSSRENNRSVIQAAWLRKAGTDGAHGAAVEGRISSAAHALRRAGKPGSTAHFFIRDDGKADLHGLLNLLEKNGIRTGHISRLAASDGSRRPGYYCVQALIHRNSPAPAGSVPEAALRKKMSAAVQNRLLLHGSKTTAGKILHAFYPQLDAAQIASVAKYSIDDLLADALGPQARFQNGKLIPPKTKSVKTGKRTVPALWRRIALDGEAAAGNHEVVRLARALTLRRLEREGLTAEDAEALRGMLRPVEIERRRRDLATGLLRQWGKALGHPTQVSKGSACTVLWKTAKSRTVEFTLDRKKILVGSRQTGRALSRWGEISYLDLVRRSQDWFRNHPQPGKKPSAGLIPLEDAPEMGDDAARPSGTTAVDWKLKVVQNKKICDRHFLLTLELPKNTALAYRPGQFFHIECDPKTRDKRPYPLTLRRPLSIHRARYPGFDPSALAWTEDIPEEIRFALSDHPARIDFLYRVVGEGTERLSRAREGTILKAIGPCGNGFSIGAERTAVIIAGGIGIAPLAALAELLRFCGKDVLVYIGAVEKEMLNLAVTRGAGPGDDDREILDAVEDEFRGIGAQILTVCTDDGSLGEKGLVTEMLERGIRDGCVPRESVRLYACGPAGMLKAVADIAAQNALPCEVSLEEHMACGIGACYACTVTVVLPDGSKIKKRVCREGPVFQARDIVWKD
jgi:dihydroorotate dehydrogenase electron transfer subunit